tara:strand:- start:135 stop:242 length:108 start_codon:yes stop_codon:yes gene_type:complete
VAEVLVEHLLVVVDLAVEVLALQEMVLMEQQEQQT